MADVRPGYGWPVCRHTCLEGSTVWAGSTVSLRFLFQVIHQGSTLFLCRGLAPGGWGSFALPTLMLTEDLPHKDGSASTPPACHILWVPDAVTCLPDSAWPPTVSLSLAHATLSLPQCLAIHWLSPPGVRRAGSRRAHTHRPVCSANK